MKSRERKVRKEVIGCQDAMVGRISVEMGVDMRDLAISMLQQYQFPGEFL